LDTFDRIHILHRCINILFQKKEKFKNFKIIKNKKGVFKKMVSNFGEALGGSIIMPFTVFKGFLIGIILSIIAGLVGVIASKNMSLGILVAIISILLNIIVMGFVLRCSKNALKKNFKLPQWIDWGKLFVNGLLGAVISLIYMLPAFIFIILGILIGVGTAAGTTALTGADPASLMAALIAGGPAFIIGLILFALAIYVYPSAMITFTINYNFLDAFKFKNVFKQAFRGNYFLMWIVIGIYILVISFVISLIPYVGSGIANFITTVTLLTAFGGIYQIPSIKRGVKK
jgi:hypothetical protein